MNAKLTQKPTSSTRRAALKPRDGFSNAAVTMDDLKVPLVFLHQHFLTPRAGRGVIASAVLHRPIPYVYDAYYYQVDQRVSDGSCTRTRKRRTQKATFLFRLPVLHKVIKKWKEPLKPISSPEEGLRIMEHMDKIRGMLQRAAVMVVLVHPDACHDYLRVFQGLGMVAFPLGVKYHLHHSETDRADRMDLNSPHAICIAVDMDSLIGMVDDPRAQENNPVTKLPNRYLTSFLSRLQPSK